MNDLLKPESIPFELSHCGHESIAKSDACYFCLKCGSQQREAGTSVLKSKLAVFPGKLNPLQNLNSQWKRHFSKPDLPFDFLKVQIIIIFPKQRGVIIDNLNEWASNLKLSSSTFFLATHFLDFYISRKPKIDASQYRVLAATALMLAAKAVELDERIPFISKLRRMTHLPYATLDFRRCECQILKELDFILQFTTLIDWVESVLTIGAVFQSDELQCDNILREKNSNSIQTRFNFDHDPPTKQSDKDSHETVGSRVNQLKDLPSYKVVDIVERIESTARKVALLIMKEGTLLYEDPKQLSLSVVAYARRVVGVKNDFRLSIDLLSEQNTTLVDAISERFPASSLIPRSNLSALTTLVRQPSVTYYPIQLQRSHTSEVEFNSLNYMNSMKHINQVYKNQYITTTTNYAPQF